MQNTSRSQSRPFARSIAVVGGIAIISALFAVLLNQAKPETTTDATADIMRLGETSRAPKAVIDGKAKPEPALKESLGASAKATSQAEIDAKRRAKERAEAEARAKAEAEAEARAEAEAEAEAEAAREAEAEAADRALERAIADPKGAARTLMADYGWGDDQFSCLDSLWTKESNWQYDARNPSSGAYGIPQSLPAEKMASAGDDYLTNPVTQIKWGLGYISDVYGTPCGAWGHSQSTGWY